MSFQSSYFSPLNAVDVACLLLENYKKRKYIKKILNLKISTKKKIEQQDLRSNLWEMLLLDIINASLPLML